MLAAGRSDEPNRLIRFGLSKLGTRCSKARGGQKLVESLMATEAEAGADSCLGPRRFLRGMAFLKGASMRQLTSKSQNFKDQASC